MIEPTPAEVIAIKADARKRFGSERCQVVRLTAPVDACFVLAPMDLRYFVSHVDARQQSVQMAQSAATVDRILWCSPLCDDAPTVDALTAGADDPEPLRRVALERLEAQREAWPVVNGEIEDELRVAIGEPREMLHATPLTAGNAPPGLSAAKAVELLAGKPTRGAGSLWAVRGGNGVSLVLRSPLSDVWLAARAAFVHAQQAKVGIVDSYMVLLRQLIVWSPEPVDAYFEAHPGYVQGLWNPLLEMGGSAAQASSTFL